MPHPAIDPSRLDNFGNRLTDRSSLARLSRAYERDTVVNDVLRQLQRGATRAVLLLGPSGSGKTAVIHEVAHRLADQQWHLLEMTPADFLRGTRYLGEWETRFGQLIEAVKEIRNVVLYLPNLEALATLGKSSVSDSNVADALAPYLTRGEIAVIGESTDEVFRHSLGANGALRRLFHVINMEPSDAETTRRVLTRVVRDAGARSEPHVLDRLMELADYYGTPSELPGRAVDLLKRSLETVQGSGIELREQDVLAAIQKATGVPTDLLDDEVRLDRARVHEFFETRVMGQPEAVNAAVDFVMMIKAGLTDPNKPQGVLLFIGPTGVGKTELAKALAEYCFGDASRLTRLDMSEFATWEASQRLLGTANQDGVLTSVIREQPFSIILMDEIEKAHPLVFDLCLQLFDAGRLTDGKGRVADFRRSLIVLTSNIGSTVRQDPPIGFQETASITRIDYDLRKYARKELGRFFRPEFLNRLDRIVHFSPLSQETAENIARRELTQVLQRGGIRRRRLQVEIDPQVIPHLLREGYSQAFGARPLKRTIERLVLLPLARLIASGRVPPGSLVRIGLRGGSIKPRLVRSEESDEGGRTSIKQTAMPAQVPVERFEALRGDFERLESPLRDLELRKRQLLEEAHALQAEGTTPQWRAVNDKIFRLEGLVERYRHLADSLSRLHDRLRERDPSRAFLAKIPDILEELELDARFLNRVLADPPSYALEDAILTVTLIESRGEDLRGVDKLARMYRRFSERQRLALRVLDDQHRDQPLEDTATFLVEGAGAYFLLANETGRHVVSQGRDKQANRQTIRVQVLPVPPSFDSIDRSNLRTEVRRLRGAGERFVPRRWEVKLYHTASMISLRAWTDCPRDRAEAHLMPWLAARLLDADGSGEHDHHEDKVVRRYRLGPNELVRDARTDLRWGRLDRLWDGALHRFLLR